MKLAVRLMVVLVALGVTSVVCARGAKGGGKKSAPPVSSAVLGTVVKVDDAATPKTLTYKTGIGETAKETSVTVNEQTTILVNGTVGKLTDLKADMQVAVTAENGVASKLETPPPADSGGKKGRKGGKRS